MAQALATQIWRKSWRRKHGASPGEVPNGRRYGRSDLELRCVAHSITRQHLRKRLPTPSHFKTFPLGEGDNPLHGSIILFSCVQNKKTAYGLPAGASAVNRAPLTLAHWARTGVPRRKQESIMAYRVAVVGATGAVGREIIKTLVERNFPASDVIALASGRSTGAEISFGEKKVLTVRNLDTFDFAGTDIGLFSPGASVSAIHAPRAAAAGCVVIDNTSHFRMDPNVPLVVPEVNPQDLRWFGKRNIVANPNCSTIQMVVALKPLHDEFKIKRVVVSTYQSVSGAGKEGMDELFNHTKSSFVYEQSPPQQFTKEIAFNCIPHIDSFMDDGATKEEWKMVVETNKILDPAILVHATCVRVPVFIGHGEAVNVEFERPVTAGEARAILRDAPGIEVVDVREDGGYVTPLECAGEDAVFVSRIRKDPTVEHGLSFWCVSDNLRKGAALNAVQIAETMIAMNLLVKKAA
jgi:aspartate-semialdehyde dehydrogenase